MAHYIILRRLNPFDFRVNKEGWWSEHSVSWLRFLLSAEGAKHVSWFWLSPLRGWGRLTMSLTGKFVYISLTISSCYCWIPLTLGLIGKDSGLSSLCHSWGSPCQQKVLKTFPGNGYIHYEDCVVWLCHLLVNLYIYGPPFHLASAQCLWP